MVLHFHDVRGKTLALIAATVAASTAPLASGALLGASDAHALSVDVQLVGGLAQVVLGPVPAAAAGTSPDTYNVTQTTASVNASALLTASLSTGLLSGHAQSDIGPSSVAGAAWADSEVDNLLARVVPGVLITPDLIRLSATTIGSNAQASFLGMTTTLSGGIVIEDAELRVAGVLVSIDANAAPNTVLFDALGIRVILNEQITTTAGDFHSIAVNAIHISVDGALQTVDADIVIGHSYAALTVPAPASGLLGVGALALLRRRRR